MVIIVNVQPEKILAFRFVGKANHDYGLLPEMLYDPAVRLDNEACEMQTDKVPREPEGSKYHYSRYLGPKSIYHTMTWTLWDSRSARSNIRRCPIPHRQTAPSK